MLIDNPDMIPIHRDEIEALRNEIKNKEATQKTLEDVITWLVEDNRTLRIKLEKFYAETVGSN